MKKTSLILVIVIICLMIIPQTVQADLGPKPSITVSAENLPLGTCYMDILVEESYEYDEDSYFLSEEYDQELVNRLKMYEDNGWRTSMTYDDSMLFGDIKCKVENGLSTMKYTYRVPDRFRIIVVSDNGETVVSNIIERKNFDSLVYFDYETGEAAEREMIPSLIIQFIFTCLLTLLVEGLVFILFRFSIKKNWLPFLLINIFTQIILTAGITLGMLMAGLFGAFIIYLLAEIVIFIIEAILFAVILKEHSIGRRIAFVVTANFLSFLTGILIILIF